STSSPPRMRKSTRLPSVHLEPSTAPTGRLAIPAEHQPPTLTLARLCKRRVRGAAMTSFDWDVLAVGLATGLGAAFIALTALRRRSARRRAQLAQAGPGNKRRRIDVVA